MPSLGRKVRLLAASLCVLTGLATGRAQTQPPAAQIVRVDGRSIRVRIAGLDGRRADQPVLVLEAGAGNGLNEWDAPFAEFSRLAPIFAYDRPGLGQSGPA